MDASPVLAKQQQQNAVLKRAVVQEQKKRVAAEEALVKSTEEAAALAERVEELSALLAALSSATSHPQSSTTDASPAATGGSSGTGWLQKNLGWIKGGEPAGRNDPERSGAAAAGLAALQEELSAKAEENERLHMRLFDSSQELQRIKEDLEQARSQLAQSRNQRAPSLPAPSPSPSSAERRQDLLFWAQIEHALGAAECSAANAQTALEALAFASLPATQDRRVSVTPMPGGQEALPSLGRANLAYQSPSSSEHSAERSSLYRTPDSGGLPCWAEGERAQRVGSVLEAAVPLLRQLATSYCVHHGAQTERLQRLFVLQREPGASGSEEEARTTCMRCVRQLIAAAERHHRSLLEMHASAASLRLAFSHRWAQRAQSACLSSSSNVAVSPMATPLARRGAAGTPMTPLSTFKAPSCSGGAIGVDVGAAAWRMHGAVRGLVQVYDDMRAAWEIILRHELPATGRLPQAHSFGPVSAPGGGIFRGDGASQELCALANRRLTEAFASLVAVLSRLELCLASILSASETADWAIDIEAALAGLEEAIIEWSCAWEAKLDADCRVGLVHSPVCNLRLAKSSVDICHLVTRLHANLLPGRQLASPEPPPPTPADETASSMIDELRARCAELEDKCDALERARQAALPASSTDRATTAVTGGAVIEPTTMDREVVDTSTLIADSTTGMTKSRTSSHDKRTKNAIVSKDVSDFTLELWAAAGESPPRSASSGDAAVARWNPDGVQNLFDGGVGADKAGDVEGLKAQSGAQAPDVAETGLIFFGEDGELLTDEDVTPSFFECASGEESKEVHDRDDLAQRIVNPSSSSPDVQGTFDLFDAGCGVTRGGADGIQPVVVSASEAPIATLQNTVTASGHLGGILETSSPHEESRGGEERISSAIGVYRVKLVRQGDGLPKEDELEHGQAKREAALKAFFKRRLDQLQRRLGEAQNRIALLSSENRRYASLALSIQRPS